MKQKIFVLMLALCLLLTGCGGNSTAQTPETTAPVPETTQAPTEVPVSLGILDGNTYTNSYAGFAFSLDENWTVYPADQLQDLPEDVEAMFEGTEFEDHEFDNITDYLAENVNDLTTMNLNYTKLSMQERLTYAMMDDEALIDSMLDNYYDTLVEAYAHGGIDVETMGKKTVTFLGRERCAMYTVASVDGVPYYLLQLYDYSLGAYGITLTLASYVEDNTEGLLDLYYTVE